MFHRFLVSLRTRLLLLLLLALLPVLGVVLATAANQRNTAVSKVRVQALYNLHLITENEMRAVENARHLLAALALLPEVRNRESAQCSALFTSLLRQYDAYVNLAAFDTEGNLFCSALPFDDALNVTDHPWFQQVLTQRRFTLGKYSVGPASDQPQIVTGYPDIDNNGQIRTVVMAGLDSNWLSSLTALTQLPPETVITVADGNGMILTRYPAAPSWLGQYFPEAALIQAQLEQQTEGFIEANDANGVSQFYAFVSLERSWGTGAFVVISIPQSVVVATVTQTMGLNLWGLALIAMLVVVAIWYGSERLILRPVRMLLRATQQLAAGNIEARSGLPHHAGEFGQLAHAFDIMAERLEQRTLELRENEERFRRIIEMAPIGFSMNDEQGIYEVVNPAYCRIVGFPQEELIGHHFSMIQPEPLWKITQEQETEFFQQRYTLDGEWTVLKRDGSRCFVLALSFVLTGDAHKPQLVSFMLDVTERKQAEEQRMLFERKLQETQKLESLGVLAGGIAHDFNNLLVAILGNASIALEELPPEAPARESLAQIELASRRAADLTRQMLAYAGKGRFLVQFIDLNTLVTEMTHLLQAAIPKHVVLRYALAQQLPSIEADATQVRQIVMNLVVNAAEAIEVPQGVITITTGVMQIDQSYLNETYLTPDLPEGAYVYLEVSDTGVGMDAATRARIFEPFFTTKFAGRGLGLAAVLGIVRGHRGALKVYSELGHGSTFKVLLPVASSPAEAVAPSNQVAPWQAKGTVLLIDDEADVRDVGRRILERIGFSVIVADDGYSGIDLFRRHATEICCVVLDMTMPRLSGEETFRRIRQIQPSARIIMMSGYNEQEVISHFGGKMLAGFLQKPFTPGDLRAVLQRVLEENPKD